MGLITRAQVSMAQISWIGGLLAESNGVITHVKFLAKVATLFGKKIWLCHGLAVIYPPPPSERRSRQRNKTSRESAAAAVWKSCYSKATLYFSIMLKFDMVPWVFRRLSVLWLIVPLDTFRFIHNQPRLLLSAIRTQHYFLQVLESSLFGDKRFSPGSDLRHWKWRGPLHHSQ